MEIDKLKRKLSSNGVKVSDTSNSIKFEPIQISQIKFILIASIFLPTLFIFLFVTGPSIIGFLILGEGISCVYHGLKSRQEVLNFNSKKLEITDNEIIANQNRIPFSEAKRFKANLSTNPLFSNIDIYLETNNQDYSVLKIWNNKSKYLNEDKYEIISGLNSIINK